MANKVNDDAVIDHRSADARPRLRKVKGLYKREIAVGAEGNDIADRKSYLAGIKAETRYYDRDSSDGEKKDFKLSRREETRLLHRDRVTDYGPGKSERFEKIRSNGSSAKIVQRGEDGISKTVRRYNSRNELKRAYERNKNGERTQTYMKRLGYRMSLSGPNVEGDRTLEKSFGKILGRRYLLEADGTKTQIGRRNFMSSKNTTLGEFGDPDRVKVKHLSGLISKTYEREGSADTVGGITKTELGRRIGFYRRKFERDLDNDTGTRTRQLGKTGRLYKVEETRADGSNDVTIKKQALFGLLQSKKTVTMSADKEASVTHGINPNTASSTPKRSGQSRLEAKLDERVHDRERSLSR